MKLLIALLLLIFIAIYFPVDCILGAEHSNHQPVKEKALAFCTWENFEVDKCASIWLIKRSIDKHAVIKFIPKGERIEQCIPFDIPEAKLRRYYNRSTFESILMHYGLKDPILIHIGKIVHDIEVNIWERKVFDETLVVQDAVLRIINQAKDSNEVIEESCRYFDALYQRIGN
jgi:hypothetical protein